MRLVAVVLAGGTGSRLYPASRPDRPKQFLDLGGDRSLLRRTVDRAAVADETYVLTGEALADRAREHAPGARVLVEPESRDTGPALVYAAHRIRERERERTRGAGAASRDGSEDIGGDPDDHASGDPDEELVLLCLPSDHHVDGEFEPTALAAARVARETGGLVTVGVEPTRAATGYGYVEPGPTRTLVDGTGYAPVERFHEKPDAETAARYRERGCYWNAGLFAWTPGALLAAARDSPLAPLVEALDDGDPDGGFAAVDPVSVDYAIMERTDDAYVVPAGFDWDDLGSWDALARVLSTDGDGNAVVGDAHSIDATGNVLAAGDGTSVSVVGVDDLVVAAYDGRVLVVPKDEAQRVREVVDALESGGAPERDEDDDLDGEVGDDTQDGSDA